MAKEKHTILHRWFEEVWNAGNADLIDDMIAPGCIAHGLDSPDGKPVKGPEDFKKFFTDFRAAFPDIRITVQETVSEDDLVVAHDVTFGAIDATHTGAAFGMQATGKPIHFEGTLMFRVRNGKAVEAWNSFDFLKLFQQMGVVRMGAG